MLYKLRKRAQGAEGFTLIELLVVILIIGILAAIAIPSFLGQRAKAQDTAAKTTVKSAQTAMETYYTDNQNYNADLAALKLIEPTLPATLDVTPGATSYTVAMPSARSADVTFSIVQTNIGAVTRTCAVGTQAAGGCKPTADAQGNKW